METCRPLLLSARRRKRPRSGKIQTILRHPMICVDRFFAAKRVRRPKLEFPAQWTKKEIGPTTARFPPKMLLFTDQRVDFHQFG
jgi:hypothetical protein